MVTPSLESEHGRAGTSPRQRRRLEGGAAFARVKRAVLTALGVALVARGVRRRSLVGVGTAILGGWLVYRGLGGNGRPGRTHRPADAEDDTGRDHAGTPSTTDITRSVTVGRPAEELYEAWRDPETFARVVGHFADVASTDGDGFRWTVRGPYDRTLAWETRIVEAEPGEFVRWETPEDALLPNTGTVRFREAPGDRGTVVTLSIRFDPPGGSYGNAALKRLDVVPKALAGRTLGRFKSLVETGEVPTISQNPSGRGSGDRV